MVKMKPKGIRIKLMIGYEKNSCISYQVTSYGSLKRDSLLFDKFREFVYISADEVREILMEKHPYHRYKIAEKVFYRNFDSGILKNHIKISEDEVGVLEKEVDFP